MNISDPIPAPPIMKRVEKMIGSGELNDFVSRVNEHLDDGWFIIPATQGIAIATQGQYNSYTEDSYFVVVYKYV